jgi:hypothetical protein
MQQMELSIDKYNIVWDNGHIVINSLLKSNKLFSAEFGSFLMDYIKNVCPTITDFIIANNLYYTKSHEYDFFEYIARKSNFFHIMYERVVVQKRCQVFNMGYINVTNGFEIIKSEKVYSESEFKTIVENITKIHSNFEHFKTEYNKLIDYFNILLNLKEYKYLKYINEHIVVDNHNIISKNTYTKSRARTIMTKIKDDYETCNKFLTAYKLSNTLSQEFDFFEYYSIEVSCFRINYENTGYIMISNVTNTQTLISKNKFTKEEFNYLSKYINKNFNWRTFKLEYYLFHIRLTNEFPHIKDTIDFFDFVLNSDIIFEKLLENLMENQTIN